MSRVDEIRKRLGAAQKVVSSLCTPRGTAGHIGWVMSIPARPDTDPDLVISAALTDCSYLLGRVEKLEGLLTRICASLDDGESGLHGSLHIDYDQLCTLESEARTLLADESKENEHAE